MSGRELTTVRKNQIEAREILLRDLAGPLLTEIDPTSRSGELGTMIGCAPNMVSMSTRGIHVHGQLGRPFV